LRKPPPPFPPSLRSFFLGCSPIPRLIQCPPPPEILTPDGPRKFTCHLLPFPNDPLAPPRIPPRQRTKYTAIQGFRLFSVQSLQLNAPGLILPEFRLRLTALQLPSLGRRRCPSTPPIISPPQLTFEFVPTKFFLHVLGPPSPRPG